MKKNNKVLCVYSPKGGVGKSTIAINIASTSFLMRKKTLLIDDDFYNGSLDLFINDVVNKTIYDLVKDINNEKYEEITNYVYSYNNYIDILCAPISYKQIDKIEIKTLKTVINYARNNYDLVIIDTSSIFDNITKTIINASDETLLILTNDMSNIKNIKNIISIFKEEDINYKVLFNNSFDFKDEYFSNYEIKSIIESNIDYTLGKEAFFKNITSYIYSSKLPILYKNNDVKYSKLVDKNELIINDLFESSENDE